MDEAKIRVGVLPYSRGYGLKMILKGQILAGIRVLFGGPAFYTWLPHDSLLMDNFGIYLE